MVIDVSVVIALALIFLIVLILMEVPIWLSLLSAGTAGLLVMEGTHVALSTLASAPFTSTAVYSFLIVPMFVLMGIVASKAGLAEDVYSVAERASRRMPGGVGIATIMACGGFAAVTGSSVATVVTIGRIGIGQMKRHGYGIHAAAAIVAVGGTLGVLIPPSVVLVVFGILTGESIGKLLMAGVIPGLLSIVLYSIAVAVLHKRGKLAPLPDEVEAPALASVPVGAGSVAAPTPVSNAGESIAESERIEVTDPITARNWSGAGYVLLLLGIIVVGLYTGWFTATESGAIAAAVALVILVIRTHRQGVRPVWEAMRETATLTAMVFAILIGGAIFTDFLVSTGVPNKVAAVVASADLSPLMVVLIALAFLLVLGTILDTLSIMVITIPIMWPILSSMGVDGIWFGILVVKAIEIGMITPPVGLNVYAVSAAHPGLRPERIFRAVIPIAFMDLIAIAILIAFPEIATWLPAQMG